MSLQITAQANRRNRLGRYLTLPYNTTATAQQRQRQRQRQHNSDTKLTTTTYILYFQPKYRTTQATLLCTYQCYSISDCLLVDLLSCICPYCSYILPVYTDRTKYIISCRLGLPYRYALVHYITIQYSTFISCKYRTVRYCTCTRVDLQYRLVVTRALFPCSILTLVYVCTARTYSTSYRSLSYRIRMSYRVIPYGPYLTYCTDASEHRSPVL
jgi:hypothetical protein